MNYHATNDYPINLNDVFKMIGFANKGNAMKTIKSNFVENEDYKTLLFRTEKQKDTDETRGRKEETIMLNIDTFKNLCMIAKTERGKEIRRYYVKLENIYNEIIKEELEENKKEKYQIEAQNALLQIELNEKEKTINVLTQEVVSEWQSVSDASDELKRSRTVVSSIIKRHNVINYNNTDCYLI
jgi:phage anti-repressor protein